MQDNTIRQQWDTFTTKYQAFFMSNEDIWNNSKHQVENYIQNHNKLPSHHDKDKNIKQLGCWILNQKINYNKQQYIMQYPQIREQWEAFTNKYQTLFMSNEDIWNNSKNQVEDYIQIHNKLPSSTDKDKNIKQLGSWLSTQKANYKNQQYIMKDPQIREQWDAFTNKYQTLFMSNEEVWNNYKHQVKDYIQIHNKLPSQQDKDKNIKQLGHWIMTQKANYNKQHYIMQDNTIRQQWEAFTNKYQTFFMSNEEVWNNSKNQVEDYIQIHNKLPSQHDKDKNIKQLGSWIGTQKQNYNKQQNIMKDPQIRQQWEAFTTKYQTLFNKVIYDSKV